MSSFEALYESHKHRSSGDQSSSECKRNLSISEAYMSSFTNSMNPGFEFGGRSYVSSGQRFTQFSSPAVYSGNEVHEQTANLANIGVTDEGDNDSPANENDDLNSNTASSPIPISKYRISFSKTLEVPFHDVDINGQANERTPLFYDSMKAQSTDRDEGTGLPLFGSDLETGEVEEFHSRFHNDGNNFLTKFLVTPVKSLPAVFLGTLLNVLDGLSYGMIMFPVSEQIFSSLGPSGLSMFYVSTIVSQLVYSLGGSALKAGIGSEMIEVTPFFHTMAISISIEMKGASPEAIIATTVVTYCISSILTGLVFFLLGKMKLGTLIGFFPRHILVGCIGGVGFFLLVTGLEVSSRLEGGLEYNVKTLNYLFSNKIVVLEWSIPLLIATVLIALQHKVHNTMVVPLYFIGVFIIFHLIVLLVPSWNLSIARDNGWVFPAVNDNEPWYSFYGLFQFHLVDWVCILKQFPSMLALTFFGILHVPINVPALAVTVGIDDLDVDKELVAHGYSNALSGLVGSIQNYLVYTNSVLFIRAGADSRIAGALLAAATAGVMFAGPVVIGYIPVCVVGALIYLLGYELLKESLYDTYGRVKRFEYTTIIIIIITMGVLDFVLGILVGILLACLSFVVEAARRPVVKEIYTGSVVRSTVLRHPKQQEFLKDVGDQICIVKLQGTLFFGSIGGVESVIRSRFESDAFRKNPIKFLILDMKGIDSVDFSAAEGFRRILNLLFEFDSNLVISSVEEDGDVIKALRDAGLWDLGHDIKLFNTLNYALEWCENSFLATYSRMRKQNTLISGVSSSVPKQKPINSNSGPSINHAIGTPRTTQIYNAASKFANDDQRVQSRYYADTDSSFKKSTFLPLIMITFSGLSDKNDKFWAEAAPYFVTEKIPEDFSFYDSEVDPPSFFIVESGLVKSVFNFENSKALTSSILPMTAFGNLVPSVHSRNICFKTVTDSVVWKLPKTKLDDLLKTPFGDKIYQELLRINIKLLQERLETTSSNLVISA